MDTCFHMERDSCRNQTSQLARNRIELQGNLEYLLEARKYVAKLRQDILDDKFRHSAATASSGGRADQQPTNHCRHGVANSSNSLTDCDIPTIS